MTPRPNERMTVSRNKREGFYAGKKSIFPKMQMLFKANGKFYPVKRPAVRKHRAKHDDSLRFWIPF